MEENTLTCSYENCSEPVYEGNECIFHCKKDSWFEINEKNEQDWSKSNEKIEYFWKQFEERLIDKNWYFFMDFVFPTFLKNSFFARDDRSEIKEYCDFNRSIFLDEAKFSNCHFMNETFFSLVQFKNGIEFSSCSFKRLESSFSFFSKKIDFLSVEFLENASFSIMFFSEEPTIIHMIGVTNHKNFTFSTQNIYQHNNPKEGFRNFRNYSYSDNPTVSDFHLAQTNILDKANAHFLLPNMSINKVWLVGLLNSGNLSIQDLKIANELFITGSDMGKSFFLNMDCSSCQSIKINRSSLSEIIFNAIKWGNKKQLEYNRDTFRQLKFAYDKQANYIEANEFYALEMKAREEELEGKKLSQDKFVFWLGGLISDHSQSWLKALEWILGFGVFMFFAYQWSIGHYHFDAQVLLEPSRYSYHWDFDAFARFMNPFSRSMDNSNCNDGYAVWLVHKIISGFLVYHFIIALRRNTKR